MFSHPENECLWVLLSGLGVHPWQSTAPPAVFQRACTIYTRPGRGLLVSSRHKQCSLLWFTVTAALGGAGRRGGVAMPGAWRLPCTGVLGRLLVG